MLDATFFMRGTVGTVPARLDFQVIGAAKSIVLTCEESVSLSDAWKCLGSAAESTFGIGLPSIPDGPWKKLFDAQLTPSAWLTASDEGGRGVSAYVAMDFVEPFKIGGTTELGPITVTLEPDVTVLGVYAGYDPNGGGLVIRARVETPTVAGGSPSLAALAGSPTGKVGKMVSFPFPMPAQNSVSVFKLKYLGIGQRVGPDPVTSGDDPMAEIFNQLETQLNGDDPREILTTLAERFYHPDRDWFVAAHLLLRGWDLKVLFNDPSMYGLEIAAPTTSPPDFFTGFLFEILYQKLGPGLGVYFGRIDLPTNLRRIPLEGFILILPNFSAWIYTNGDFRINVGWPLGANSIGIQLDVLLGSAGFYFAKLRSGDDPGAVANVNYDPILEFGIGVSVSASVSADAGILSASLSVAVSATLQGLLAWEAGGSDSGATLTRIPDHYWFAGSAGLCVLLTGCVDFVVIKASISISLAANVDVAFETGYSTLIAVSAEVEVSASVHVIFFTIHFSFSAHVSHSFTIGSGPNASPERPLAPGLSVAAARLTAPLSPFVEEALQAVAYSRAVLPRVPPTADRVMARSVRFAGSSPSKAVIDVYFALLPTMVYGAGSPADAAVELVATLVAEAPPPGAHMDSPGAATNFELLVVRLVTWLLAQVPETSPSEALSQRLEALADELGHGGAEPTLFAGGADGFTQAVKAFLAATFTFDIVPVTPASPSLPQSMAVLPMFDVLELEIPDSPGVIDFGTHTPVPDNYREAIDVYYADLGMLGAKPPMSSAEVQGEAGSPPVKSMATQVLGDFFLMLARKVINDLVSAAQAYESEHQSSLHRAVDAARAGPSPVMAVHRVVTDHLAATDEASELAALLDAYDFSGAAGMGSRFMLGGLQLPDPARLPTIITPETMRNVPVDSLLRLSGQGFAVSARGATVSATLRIGAGRLAPWIRLPAGSPDGAVAKFDVPAVAALPSSPDPVWLFPGSPGSPGPVAPGDLVVRPLPSVAGAPMRVILKQQIAWTAESGGRTIYPLPEPLLALAQAGTINLDLAERWQAGSPPPSPSPVAGVPGLLIRLTVSEVPDAGGGSIPYVYLLGGADEETRERIYQALENADFTGARISLLYSKPGETTLSSEDLSEGVLLARTNLSTDNQASQSGSLHMLRMLTGPAADTDVALLSEPQAFLRLVWEVSVVHAPGYFLHYRTADGQGLPKDLFADNARGTGSPGEGAVVPDTSGFSAPFAILVQFAASSPSGPVPVTRFENCVVAESMPPGASLVASVLDENRDPVLSYSQGTPTGSIGFAIDWAQSQDSPAAPIPVHQLYHLVQYAVTGGGGFIESDWSLPVGPTGRGDGSPGLPWRFQQVIPLYRFLAADSPAGSPAAGASPYDILGRNAALRFRLIDIFGNALPSDHQMDFAPLYNDALVGPSDWPGVQTSYEVTRASGAFQGAALTINLTFHPDSLEPPSSSPGSAETYWRALAARYQAIAWQLGDPGVSVTIATSLMAGGSPVPPVAADPKRVLVDFIARIADWLDDGNPRPSPGVLGAVIEGEIPFADIALLPHNVLELTVALGLSRDPDRVDPEARGKLPSSVSVETAILPNWGVIGSPVGTRAFALGFESAFSGFAGPGSKLKLAQRSGTQSGVGSQGVPDLWVVRFGEQAGIAIDFHAQAGQSPTFSPGYGPVYFALAPLSTTLQAGTVDGTTYSGIDIDAWARDYLTTLDGVLDPKIGTAIAILDKRYGTSHFQDLLDVKERLAKGVVAGIAPVLAHQEGAGDPEAARERLTQAMLEQLASAYGVSTIIQVPASVTVIGTPDDGSPGQMAPQFYGTLGPSSTGSGGAHAYSLSAATLDVAPSSAQWVTSLLTVAQPQDNRCITLPLDYQISFMQHDFLVDDEYEGLTPSSWLKFVVPGDEVLSYPIAASPGVEIPVPLPFQPPLPLLQGQSGTGAPLPSPTVPSSPASVVQEIEDALKWSYTADLSVRTGEQDQLNVEVTFNSASSSPGASSLAGLRSIQSLFEALARFRAAWSGTISEQIPAIVAEAFPDVGSPPVHSPAQPVSPASPNLAREAIAALVAQAQAVASAWLEEPPPQAFAGAQPPEVETLFYRFELTGSPAVLTAFGKADGGGEPSIWPVLSNQDGSAAYPLDSSPAEEADGWYRIQVDAPKLDFDQLRLTWTPLDLLTRRSGDLAAWVVRNADLIDGAETNGDFVYVSPTTAFKSPIIPIIVRDRLTPIRLGPITLEEVLTDILTPLAATGADFEPNLTFTAGWSYVFATTSTGEGLLPATSVTLLNDVPLAASGGSAAALARDVTRGIWDWLTATRPPSDQPCINLGLTLFGTIDGERLPLIQIADIPVIVSDLAQLKPSASV